MNLPETCLLPTSYFPPVSYFIYLLHFEKILAEQMETYPKQTYRNRCEIMTSAGKLNLIVPVSKPDGNHTLTRDIEISYREHWQQHHWKSILSAYRSSPYFNYYADLLHPLFIKKEKSLFNLNQNILTAISQIIGIKPEIGVTSDYIHEPEGVTDLRRDWKPGKKIEIILPEYPQVFSHLHGFMPNLSILDLIANTGPDTKEYLLRIKVR